jgi:ribosomal protein S18 acetylase RimI-like enzyme
VRSRRPPGGVVFRLAEERDGPSLASFRCSRGASHDDDVERFVQQSALARALAPNTTYRLIVVLEDDRLAAVAAHHPELLLVSTGGNTFRGTEAVRLQLLALSLADQGRRMPDGRRLSDLAMETLIAEALGDRRERVLTGIVAKDNLRSLALCERHGLRSQIEFDARHVRVSGSFRRRT